MHICYYRLLFGVGGGRVGISEMCVESLIVILKLKKGYILNSFYYGICSGNTSLRCISEEFCSMHLLQSFMNFLSNTCNTHLLYMYLESQCVEI